MHRSGVSNVWTGTGSLGAAHRRTRRRQTQGAEERRNSSIGGGGAGAGGFDGATATVGVDFFSASVEVTNSR